MIPLVALHFLMLLGLAYLLSIFGLFVRDIRDLVQIFLTVGIFITPVIFTPDILGGKLGLIVKANPFSYPIFCFQDVLFFGRFEHPEAWIVFPCMSLILFLVGRFAFMKLKPAMGDVI